MGFSHITVHSTSPAFDQHLRNAREERAATVYAAFRAFKRAISAGINRLAEPVNRARRADRTFRALNALSDDLLRDIGVSRADIDRLAEAVQGAGSGLTLEDLRRLGIVHAPGETSRGLLLPREEMRRRRPRAAPQLPSRPYAGTATGTRERATHAASCQTTASKGDMP